jgi:hypothetical protein
VTRVLDLLPDQGSRGLKRSPVSLRLDLSGHPLRIGELAAKDGLGISLPSYIAIRKPILMVFGTRKGSVGKNGQRC